MRATIPRPLRYAFLTLLPYRFVKTLRKALRVLAHTGWKRRVYAHLARDVLCGAPQREFKHGALGRTTTHRHGKTAHECVKLLRRKKTVALHDCVKCANETLRLRS
jgi:hypothetical protein